MFEMKKTPQIPKSLTKNKSSFRSSSVGTFGDRLKSLRLHVHQSLPFEIYGEESVDGLLRGLATQPVQRMDASFTSEVSKFEF